MPTKQQKDPGKLNVTRQEVQNFFAGMWPACMTDFLDSDALRDRVLAIVAEAEAQRPSTPAPSVLYLPNDVL